MITTGRIITYKCDLCGNSIVFRSNECDEVWCRYQDNVYPDGWKFVEGKLYCDKHKIKRTLLIDSIIIKTEDY